MRTIVFLLYILSISLSCESQGNTLKSQADSVGMISRAKADTILKYIDTIQGIKLLYSLRDMDYYVVTKRGIEYKEYFIKRDSIGNITVRSLITDNKTKKMLTNAFNLKQYHNGLITTIPNAKYVEGEPSYFVIKDGTGKRFGEYSLSSLTLPTPIDAKLYGYLVRRITEEATKNNKVR